MPLCMPWRSSSSAILASSAISVTGNMRIGIQQTFETVYNGKNIDIDSWSADFPEVTSMP